MLQAQPPQVPPETPPRNAPGEANLWRLAKHRFEISPSEVAAVFWFLFSLQLCHTHVYMTPGPLSSEHIFEKGKSGSGSRRPSPVSKCFPFPKALPFELGQNLPPGLMFLPWHDSPKVKNAGQPPEQEGGVVLKPDE